MGEWKKDQLGKICNIFAGGDAPDDTSPIRTNILYVPVYSNGISRKGLYGYTSKSRVNQDAITISARGTIGAVFFRSEPFFPIVRLITVFPRSSGLDTKFLYYRLLLVPFAGDGSAVKQLTVPMISEYEIDYPPLPTQRKIAAVLGAIDDKIETNRKICANLEAQAQALFKSWFVDFEPFGGKMPKDWKIVRLENVCSKITDGSHSSPKELVGGKYPMLSVKDMGQFDFEYSTSKYISESDYLQMLANGCVPLRDDVLVAKDGSYLKSIFIVNENKEQAVLSSIAIFRPNTVKISPEYLLWFLKSPSTISTIRNTCVTGSGVPRVVLQDFKSIPFVLPSMQDMQRPVELLRSVRWCIDKNVKESRALASMRDALLPRLMSGEIDVEKVEVA